MNLNVILVFALVGYLIGSVLFARMVSYFCGIDISKVGSGNSGTTNAVRTIGKTAGILAFLGDFFKSFAAMALVLRLQPIGGVSSADLAIAMMLGVVFGYNFPILRIIHSHEDGEGVAGVVD
jgi:glycerol-3-phosphate acyltransferase PlsY